MQPFTHFVFHVRLHSGLVAILVTMNVAVDGLSQEPDRTPTLTKQTKTKLAVGMEVVFKTSPLPVSDQERQARSTIHPPLVIDRIATNRVSICSRHKKMLQWVPQDQVIPFDEAIDEVTREITKHRRDPNLYASRAQLWMNHGDDRRARADLDQAIGVAPTEPWLYVRRGKILLHQRQFEQALADCNKAIELAPNDEQAYLTRAKVATATAEYQRAGADLDEAIRLDPADPYAWGERSRFRLLQNKPDTALDDINEAIRLVNSDPSFLRWRGNAWAAKGEDDKAIIDFSEAIRLDPEDAPSFEGRAKAWLQKGKHEMAVADVTEAIQLEPRSGGLYLLRGNVWYKQHTYDKAIEDDTAAIELDPKSAFAYACRAQAHVRNHERDLAIADYNQAIELDRTNALYRLFRASCLSLQGKHDQAMLDYDEAVRIEPNNPANYVYRGRERLKDPHDRLVQNSANAFADFDRATAIDPTYADAYYQRSQIWKLKRAHYKVVGEYTALIERNPDHPLGHQGLAWTLASCDDARVRDGQRAVREATHACELTHWKDENCLDTLAAAYAEAGNFTAAVKSVDRAIELLGKAPLAGDDLLLTFQTRRALYLSFRPCRE
jgi:tetratricopeptide (TPR) repeat protein